MAIQKILIVDDSPTERYYLTDILIKNGFSVSTAENGEDALLKIKADKPQLILMDVVMPGKNGFQVTRAISRDPETQDVPVIICTSKNQETDRIWGLRQGATDYLVKPIDADELLAKIAALG
jgi:twitching motility two-component system response regulator PilH